MATLDKMDSSKSKLSKLFVIRFFATIKSTTLRRYNVSYDSIITMVTFYDDPLLLEDLADALPRVYLDRFAFDSVEFCFSSKHGQLSPFP